MEQRNIPQDDGRKISYIAQGLDWVLHSERWQGLNPITLLFQKKDLMKKKITYEIIFKFSDAKGYFWMKL